MPADTPISRCIVNLHRKLGFYVVSVVVMAALRSRCGHYIFVM